VSKYQKSKLANVKNLQNFFHVHIYVRLADWWLTAHLSASCEYMTTVLCQVSLVCSGQLCRTV